MNKSEKLLSAILGVMVLVLGFNLLIYFQIMKLGSENLSSSEFTGGEAIASQLSKDESSDESGFEGYFECDTMPQLIEYPLPKYPELMEKAGVEGMTILRLLVDEEGRVKEIHVMESSGHRPLDEAAMQAATKTLFKPGKVSGRAVPCYVSVPYRFELKDKENKK